MNLFQGFSTIQPVGLALGFLDFRDSRIFLALEVRKGPTGKDPPVVAGYKLRIKST